MLFIPWRNEQKDLLASFDTFEAHYNSLKTSIESKCNENEDHTEEPELARQMIQNEENAFDQIAPNTEQENREAEAEGVKEAENFIYLNQSRVVEQRHYDIGIELQFICSVPPVETTGIMLPDEEYLTLPRSLNLGRREFFNHIVHWIKCKDEPIYAFLTGGAGVGNSVVIRALYQSLYRILNLRDGEYPDDIRILLCAYMGFAAFNISGQTICSAFHKNIYQGTSLLSADELNTFRIKYRHLKVVIIDEISMVGNQTLSFIDTRLQQLTGTKAVFGGLSVIAVGDLYQLKPVVDKLICLDLEEGASSLARNLWKELFKMYELVDVMRQKYDLDHYWIGFGWMKWQRKTKISCRHVLLSVILVTIQRMFFICLPRICMWMNIMTKFSVICQEKKLWYHVMTVLSQQTFQLKSARNWLSLFLMIAKKKKQAI